MSDTISVPPHRRVGVGPVAWMHRVDSSEVTQNRVLQQAPSCPSNTLSPTIPLSSPFRALLFNLPSLFNLI